MLEIKNVYKTFYKGTVNERVVLNNLSLTIDEGDFVTVIGGNGAGKSTLMNIICGNLFPDSGTIKIDGVDITHLPSFKRAKYFGRVFQDPMIGTSGEMQIVENLALAYRRGKKRTFKWGISEDEKNSYKKTLSQLGLGLEDRLSVKANLLSGGQRQALTLIMAVLSNPSILLLDEHTAALDPKTALTVLQLTERIIAEKKLTTLMITHNMSDALRYGNRLIMMKDGSVAFDLKGDEKQNTTIDDLLRKFDMEI